MKRVHKNFKAPTLLTMYRILPDKNGFVPLCIDGKRYKNYRIDEDGNIYSLNYNKFIKPRPNKGGYLTVAVSENNKRKNMLVHRAVADSFIPVTQEDINKERCTINHIDGNKTNNNVNNLERTTILENARHARTHGLISPLHQKLIDYEDDIVELFKIHKNITDTYKACINKGMDLSKEAVVHVIKRRGLYKAVNDTHDIRYREYTFQMAKKYPEISAVKLARLISSQIDKPINQGTICGWIGKYRRTHKFD